MAQHDYVLSNQSGLAFRSDLNNALAALVTQNSGAAQPSTTYAYMPWSDTTTGIFKIRNAADNGFVSLFRLDGTFSLMPPADGAVTTAKLANDAVTPAKLSQPLTRGTQVSPTGATANFTGIPSWARRITVMFSAGLSGTAHLLFQLGDSGGIETSSYISTSNYLQGGGTTSSTSSTAGIVALAGDSANFLVGSVVFTNMSGNYWIATGVFNYANTIGVTGFIAGEKTLSGTLDRVRITSSNGTDTFVNTNINIMYEG